MIRAEVSRIAEGVVRPALEHLGFDHMTIREGSDSTDDPALFVDVFFKPGSDGIPTEISSRLRHALSESLLKAGETRFPYLRLRHPDDEEPVEPPVGKAH